MAGKKGAPMGNKNAVGRHSGFVGGLGAGLAFGGPIGSLATGGVIGASRDKKLINQVRSGAAVGSAIQGGIIGGVLGGPVGALGGAASSAVLNLVGTKVGSYAGEKGAAYYSKRKKK